MLAILMADRAFILLFYFYFLRGKECLGVCIIFSICSEISVHLITKGVDRV